MTADIAPHRRSCYVNFGGHLLNAFNPNMTHPDLPNRWSDEDWSAFIDMIQDFGFNTFQFWLIPKLFSPAGMTERFGELFSRQMRGVIEYAAGRGVAVEMICSLSAVGENWHTHCPNVKAEWDECLHLWDYWTRQLPGLGAVMIFPGDPGGCSRNGCTTHTFIDGALQVAQIIKRNLPDAEVELSTWGSPFFGWGTMPAGPNSQGQFIPEIQHTGFDFDKDRADDAMTYLLRRLGDFPADTSVAINLAFNPDGDFTADDGRQDARQWAREIAKTHRILTWDFYLTESENAIVPHYRFDRLFAQRRRERQAAPYSGGICFTMTPLLNQLSLYQSAQSLLDPDADHRQLTRQFYQRLFGPQAGELADLLPLLEVIPDQGNYAAIDLDRPQYHRQMQRGRQLLRDLAGTVDQDVPFHPSVDTYRRDLLFYFDLFAELSGPAPDFDELARRYWKKVYAIHDSLPAHVDPRPHMVTSRVIGFFDPNADHSRLGLAGGTWTD